MEYDIDIRYDFILTFEELKQLKVLFDKHEGEHYPIIEAFVKAWERLQITDQLEE